jgi:hypothetical protein
MSPLVRDLLSEVTEAGDVIRLDDGNLHLSASNPLPDDLRVRLRDHKTEVVAFLERSLRQPGLDWIFDACELDPLLDDDRLEAVRIWMGMPTGPPRVSRP